jgi:hypothetical protein
VKISEHPRDPTLQSNALFHHIGRHLRNGAAQGRVGSEDLLKLIGSKLLYAGSPAFKKVTSAGKRTADESS